MTLADPLEHLLRLVERLRPTGFIGDGMVAEMQDAAARVRLHHGRRFGLDDLDRMRVAVEWAQAQSCAAVQQSDEMACGTCDLRWDVNDPEPPNCPRRA